MPVSGARDRSDGLEGQLPTLSRSSQRSDVVVVEIDDGRPAFTIAAQKVRRFQRQRARVGFVHRHRPNRSREHVLIVENRRLDVPKLRSTGPNGGEHRLPCRERRPKLLAPDHRSTGRIQAEEWVVEQVRTRCDVAGRHRLEELLDAVLWVGHLRTFLPGRRRIVHNRLSRHRNSLDSYCPDRYSLPSPSVIASSLLLRLARDLRTTLDQRFAHEGLTSQQAGLMVHVFTGVTSPTALADALGTDSAGITRMIDRLTTKGLLERAPDFHDRRAVSIKLTSAGAQLVKRLPAIFEEVAAQLVIGVDPNQVIADIKAMIDNLSAE